MATSNPRASRFRSATEFPKTIEELSHCEAVQLYVEMRECLIFTNRSRGQLLRRNEEHKQSTLKLKLDVERLQTLINQLRLEKKQLIEGNQNIVSELEREIESMTKHLDQLSSAFDPVSEDLENPTQIYWSFLALPQRFFEFIHTVKAVVLSWRKEQHQEIEGTQIINTSIPQLPGTTARENERRERPQMYIDPASINRDLLDR